MGQNKIIIKYFFTTLTFAARYAVFDLNNVSCNILKQIYSALNTCEEAGKPGGSHTYNTWILSIATEVLKASTGQLYSLYLTKSRLSLLSFSSSLLKIDEYLHS
jgi:hypothetical protein